MISIPRLLASALAILTIIVLCVVLLPTISTVNIDIDTVPIYNSRSISTNAGGAVLMEANSHRVLWSQNAHQQMPMASTTKIFTALAVLNQCSIDDVVTVDKQAVGVEGSSIYLKADQQLTVYDLLCGLMLRSGNDSAVALAIHCSGSVEAFAQYVNDMCDSYGLVDTNITNPHGLHDSNHYTSAYDLALISCIAQHSDTFAEIVSSKSATLHYLDSNTETLIYNKNKMLSNYDGADGIKTGYTQIAGRCLVASATKQNMQLVAVVLDCYNMWTDTATMLDYGYSNYTMTNIVPQNAIFYQDIDGYRGYFVSDVAYNYPVNNNGNDDIITNITASNNGFGVDVVINNEHIATLPLRAINM